MYKIFIILENKIYVTYHGSEFHMQQTLVTSASDMPLSLEKKK